MLPLSNDTARTPSTYQQTDRQGCGTPVPVHIRARAILALASHVPYYFSLSLSLRQVHPAVGSGQMPSGPAQLNAEYCSTPTATLHIAYLYTARVARRAVLTPNFRGGFFIFKRLTQLLSKPRFCPSSSAVWLVNPWRP